MTTWFTRLTASALLLASLGLNACKKDETQVVLKTVAAPALTASTTTPDLVLSSTNGASTADVFTFTAADYGFQAATTYSLQIDKKGGNFSSPQTFSAGTTAGTVTLTKSQLATAFFNLGYASGATSQVDARLISAVGATNPTVQTSPVITLTATPTVAPPSCVANATGRTWSLIGPAGIDWNTDIPLTYDCYTQTFKVTMALNAAEFKFRANKDWSVNFGIAAATSTITAAGLSQGLPLVNNNNNLQIPTAGTYTITLTPSADGTSGTVVIK